MRLYGKLCVMQLRDGACVHGEIVWGLDRKRARKSSIVRCSFDVLLGADLYEGLTRNRLEAVACVHGEIAKFLARKRACKSSTARCDLGTIQQLGEAELGGGLVCRALKDVVAGCLTCKGGDLT